VINKNAQRMLRIFYGRVFYGHELVVLGTGRAHRIVG
jgi:hypothetical protein